MKNTNKLQSYIDSQGPLLSNIELSHKEKDFKIGVFVINLKHRTDKLNIIKESLYRAKISDYTIVDAVYGQELSEEEVREHVDTSFFLDVLDDNQLTRPEIGCSASHNKIYETIIKENYSHAIIFEDDSQIRNNFSKALQKIKKEKFDFYFDFLLLGYFGTNDLSVSSMNKKVAGLSVLEFSEEARKKDTVWGSHAYIISNSGAQKMLLINKKIKFRADGPWNFFLKSIKLYATEIKFANQIGRRRLQNDIIERSPSPRG
jgi:glycosyl transferase family 25